MLTVSQRQQFRQAEADLDSVTIRQLTALLASMDTPGSDAFIRDLLADLPILVADLSDVSSLIGVAAYDLSREQSAARGRFFAEPAAPPTVSWVEGIAKTALFTRTKEFPDRTPPELITSRLESSVPRVVRSGSRLTVITNTARDPVRPRYRRVVHGKGCDFCHLLAGRSYKYRSQDTADFQAHDHCGCSAEPEFPEAS